MRDTLTWVLVAAFVALFVYFLYLFIKGYREGRK